MEIWLGWPELYEGQHERLGGRSARPTARRLFAGQVALSLEILFGSISGEGAAGDGLGRA